MTSKLAPCPFCGSAPQITHNGYGHVVKCINADCNPRDWHLTPDRAAAAWNAQRAAGLEAAKLVEEKARVGHLAEELIDNDTYRAYCGVVAGFSEPVWAVDTMCTELREYDLSKLTCVDCASWYVTHAEAQLSDFSNKIKEAKALIKKAGAK